MFVLLYRYTEGLDELFKMGLFETQDQAEDQAIEWVSQEGDRVWQILESKPTRSGKMEYLHQIETEELFGLRIAVDIFELNVGQTIE